METNQFLKNPQLNGEPFFWKAGPVGVVMLHGFTATPAEVRGAAERLHAQGYSVAGPLLPGHGTQPSALNRVRWQDWVAAGQAEYQRLMETCQHVFLLGESMGGVAALYLATQLPQAAGVLAFAPALRLRLSRWQRLQMRLLAPFVEAVPKGQLDADDQWQGYRVNPLKGVLQLLAMQQALLGRIHLLRQPLFIAQGRLDTTVDPRVGEIILNAAPARLQEMHWYERSSHVVLLDQELDAAMANSVAFMDRALA